MPNVEDLSGLTSPFSGIWNIKAMLLMVLIVAIIVESIGIVYIKHLNRDRFAVLQTIKREQDKLHIEWGQLLLERGTLAAESRVEKIAREQLGMVIPDSIQQIRPKL